MVKKEGAITLAEGPAYAKVWRHKRNGRKLSCGGGQGQPPKGLISHSKKFGPSPESNLLTFSRGKTAKGICEGQGYNQCRDWCRHPKEKWQDRNHDYGMGMRSGFEKLAQGGWSRPRAG